MEKVFREIKQQPEFFATRCLDFPAHIHEDIELVFVKSGVGTAYCDGKKYTLTPRTFFLVFPNQVHHYVDCNTGEYILLTLKPSQLLGNRGVFMKGYPTTAVWCANGAADTHAVALLQMALEESENNGYSPVIDAYLTAFFEKLMTFYTIERGKVSSNTVLRILQYCAEHYKEDITVAEVAQELQISISSVSHIFSQRLAITFCDHINSLRLVDAVRLLKNQSYSITEISDMAGFPTIRTFNRVFRKQYGVSPSTYRKQLSE